MAGRYESRGPEGFKGPLYVMLVCDNVYATISVRVEYSEIFCSICCKIGEKSSFYRSDRQNYYLTATSARRRRFFKGM